MAKETAIAVGGGAAGAILYLATFLDAPGGMILAYLALLPLLAAGLSTGAAGGAIAAATATVLVGAVSSLVFGGIFAVVYAAPAAVLVRQALRPAAADDEGDGGWTSSGRLLAGIVLYGCGLFAAAALTGGEANIAAMVREIESVLGQVLPAEDNPRMAELMKGVAGFFPAILIFSWAIMVIANAAIAQSLLTRAGRAIRPTPRYAMVELPAWYGGALAAAAGLALVAPWFGLGAVIFVARNVALAMLAPVFLVGLAVIHVWTRGKPARGVILAGCYLVLLVFGWPALLVAGLGFMEQWLQLRRRIAGGSGQEEER